MNETIPTGLTRLQIELKYFFQNPDLLKQALTRQSAIEEKTIGAATQCYQGLEFVGDAALKHVIAKILFERFRGKATPDELHTAAVRLISNNTVMPEIARKLKLSDYIFRGKGENVLTDKMLADGMEAILGAISIDNHGQEPLEQVIKRLWEPFIPSKNISEQKTSANTFSSFAFHSSSSNTASNSFFSSLSATSATSTASSYSTPPLASAASAAAQPPVPKLQPSSALMPSSSSKKSTKNNSIAAPLTPRSQTMFGYTSKKATVKQFESAVANVSDVNQRNIGKKGDTALIKLLRKDNLKTDLELSKIEILLKRGASWTTPNNLGQTAESLANKHPQKEQIAALRSKYR